MGIWSLRDLEHLILPGLGRLDGKLLEKVVKIARSNEPVAAYDLTEATLRNYGYSQTEAVSIARSSSWLAVVNRDKRSDEFEQIVVKIKEGRD